MLSDLLAAECDLLQRVTTGEGEKRFRQHLFLLFAPLDPQLFSLLNAYIEMNTLFSIGQTFSYIFVIIPSLNDKFTITF